MFGSKYVASVLVAARDGTPVEPPSITTLPPVVAPDPPARNRMISPEFPVPNPAPDDNVIDPPRLFPAVAWPAVRDMGPPAPVVAPPFPAFTLNAPPVPDAPPLPRLNCTSPPCPVPK